MIAWTSQNEPTKYHQENPARHKMNKKKKQARTCFVRNVFIQALEIVELQGQWLTLHHLVDSINNVFLIKAGLELSADEFSQMVTRWEPVQLCIKGKLTEANDLGFYASSIYKIDGEKCQLFQIAPGFKGSRCRLPTNIGGFDADTSRPVQIKACERYRLIGDIADDVGQKRLLILLELDDKGYFEGFNMGQLSSITVAMEKLNVSALISPDNSFVDVVDIERKDTENVDVKSQRNSYWESTMAAKLFEPKDDRDSYEEVLHKIQILTCSMEGYEGPYSIISGLKPDEKVSDYQVFNIRWRAVYLNHALTIAKDKMPERTWSK